MGNLAPLKGRKRLTGNHGPLDKSSFKKEREKTTAVPLYCRLTICHHPERALCFSCVLASRLQSVVC